MLAVVEDFDLMPDVGNGVGIGCAIECVAPLEVLGNLEHGFAALAGRVLECARFVDDELCEFTEEGRVLFGQPDSGVVVGDVDVSNCAECCVTVVGIGYAGDEVRCKLPDVCFPCWAHQRLGADHKGLAGVALKQLDVDTGLACAGVRRVKDTWQVSAKVN